MIARSCRAASRLSLPRNLARSQCVPRNLARGLYSLPNLALVLPRNWNPIRTYAVSTSGEHVEQLIDDISPSEYNRVANDYLETLSEDIEELAETFPQLDSELAQGVMTLTVAEGKTYVINKQPPNKQIWLSSPISGPKRYDLIGGKWVTLRDNSLLTALLEEELSAELGETVELTVDQ